MKTLASTRVNTHAAPEPSAMPAPAQPQCMSQDVAHHAHLAGTKGDPDGDVSPPLRDYVGEHAVDTKHPKHERHAGEH